MKPFPVATGVFKRIGLFVFLLPLLVVLGGCSLFGIATKGNLNELAEKQDQEHLQLQTEVRESERKMDGRVTEVEDKTRQLDMDLIRYETEIQSAKLQLQAIALDLEAFENDLDSAHSKSKQALRMHHESIISERDRLRQRLNEIDQLILSWDRERTTGKEGNLTPVPGGVIVPEEGTGSPKTTSAEQASNETSVWKNRSQDGN